jgi:hypothetical protein
MGASSGAGAGAVFLKKLNMAAILAVPRDDRFLASA